MVVEISYEKYKAFCSYLPCKDVFYFIKNLFIKFPNDDTIYAIKYDFKKGPEVSYNNFFQKYKDEEKIFIFIKHINLDGAEGNRTPVQNTAH